jgi:hypothetical protein
MQVEQNLMNQFDIPGLSQSDILEYFQQGDSHAKDGIYYFLADNIKVEFNKKGKFKSIKGPKDSFFVKRAIKDLKEIANESGFEIGRIIIQGSSPLVGYYRYKDLFQISPLKSPPKYITSGRSKFPYPFLIEYNFRTSKNHGIRGLRQRQMKENILLILNLLIFGGIFDLNNNTNNNIWIQVPKGWKEPSDEDLKSFIDFYRTESMETNNMYLRSGYSLNSIDININQFASTEDIPNIEIVDFREYYSKLGIGINDTINLPSIINTYLDSYFSLDDKNKFNRALYWFLKHYETWKVSKSISYNCLVQSIEVLMDSEKNTAQCNQNKCDNTKILNELCGKCGSPISVSGPTQAFRDFVEKYAGNIPKKLKNELYSLRSSISHGSLILEMDTSTFGGFDAKSHNQRNLLYLGRQIVSACLRNWLIEKK